MRSKKYAPRQTEEVLGKTENEVHILEQKPSPVQSKAEDINIKSSANEDYSLEVIMDYDGKIDPFYLSKKDPDNEYRFLRADDKNLSTKTGNLLFQRGGWQIVGRNHAIRIGVHERFISPDGIYHVGDTVLAFMPKSLYSKKEEYKRKEANERMGRITKLIDEGDPNNPDLVGIGHQNMKGLQTKRALKM